MEPSMASAIPGSWSSIQTRVPPMHTNQDERLRYGHGPHLASSASITSIIWKGVLIMATRIIGRAQQVHDGANSSQLHELQLG